jgi:hypothetical protein
MHAIRLVTGSAKRCLQRGQAMTEFTIAAAFVLVPLFLMLPLLGKFMDMKASSIQAARYAAWERTAWYGNSDWAVGQKSDAAIQAEVQTLFFTEKALWNDHAGESILAGNSTSLRPGQTPGTMNTILGGVTTAVNTIGKIVGTNFKVDMESLYTSTVTLQAAKTDAVGRAWGDVDLTAPTFTMTQVLVTNGWSANGPAFVESQTKALAPLSLGQRPPVKWVLDTLQNGFGFAFTELRPSSLKLGGGIYPDKVPPDRLSAAPPPEAPKPTTQQRADADSAKPTREATDKVQEGIPGLDNAVPKTNAMNEGIRSAANQIKQCGIDKQAEGLANTKVVCTTVSFCSVDTGKAGCTVDSTRQSCGVPPPPNGGTSYTPLYDSNPACNASIDNRIKDLKKQLADPVLLQAKKRSDDMLAATPALKDSPTWMADRASVYKVLDDWQKQLDLLVTEQNKVKQLNQSTAFK